MNCASCAIVETDRVGGFTALEREALSAIFADTPEGEEALRDQLAAATVSLRENTGHGFLTTIVVSASTPGLPPIQINDGETYARVDGLRHGVGFVLRIEDGRLVLLDTYCLGGEGTAHLSPHDLAFRIARTPSGDG